MQRGRRARSSPAARRLRAALDDGPSVPPCLRPPPRIGGADPGGLRCSPAYSSSTGPGDPPCAGSAGSAASRRRSAPNALRHRRNLPPGGRNSTCPSPPEDAVDTLALLETLSNTFGVSGFEDDVREVIRPLAAECADEVRTDVLGNLIATKRGRSPRTLMLDAHMDEIGFIINHVEESGFLRF